MRDRTPALQAIMWVEGTMRSFTVFSFLLCSGCCFGQGTCVPPPESLAIKALASGTVIPGIGSCDLKITTQSREAKALVQQGFSLIHCFWFNEAVRSFRDATLLDPTCTSAWLGLNAALTLPWHSPGQHKPEAEYAIRRAVETCGGASDLEQSLVAAFRLRSHTEDDREGEFERAMMRVIADHPESFEPRLLLSAIRTQLCMNDDYDEKLDPRTELTKVLALVDPILAKSPDNAAALHYRVHALEGSQPERAVESADRLAKAAPASGHMVHMPGHIYNRVGQYERARQAFLASVRVHEMYATKIPGATPDVDWNYGHDLDYLIFNLAEMGRLKEAEELLPKNNSSWRDLAWRAGQWQKLAEKAKDPFFVGMAAVEKGDLAAATTEAETLEKSLAKTIDQSTGRYMTTRLRVEQVQACELRGLILSKQGRHEEAMAKVAQGVAVFDKIGYSEPPYYPRPPQETQGALALAAGNWRVALEAYRNGLRHRPNSGWLLYGVAAAHELAGQQAEARKAYQAFLAAWKGADEDLPQMMKARAYLEKR